MKGFTKDGKFHPITDYKKGTRKSRDQSAKTQGVRMKRLTQLQVDEIKQNVLPLDKHALMMMKFNQGLAKRDRFASPKWNSMTQAERLKALKRSGVHESAIGQKLQSREELSKLPYHKLPHYAKTNLAFNFFNLDREGGIRKQRISGYDRWVTSAPDDDGEQQGLEEAVSENLNLNAEQIAKIKPSWWEGESIGDVFNIESIRRKLQQEREMKEYFDAEARRFEAEKARGFDRGKRRSRDRHDDSKIIKEIFEAQQSKGDRLVDQIRHGDKVTIVRPNGQLETGRAVMKSGAGDNSWVLNTGGEHGERGAIAFDDNVVKVVETR